MERLILKWCCYINIIQIINITRNITRDIKRKKDIKYWQSGQIRKHDITKEVYTKEMGSSQNKKW